MGSDAVSCWDDLVIAAAAACTLSCHMVGIYGIDQWVFFHCYFHR